MTALESHCVVLPRADVDTDQIIPAQFLKGTTRAGLGRWLFARWRYDESGAPRPDFPLARPEARDAAVLVAGPNFGCGSSREHAAWALTDYGFRAVVAPTFGDIFRANALENGLLPVAVSPAFHERLIALATPTVRIDLEATTIALLDAESGDSLVEHFPIDPFARFRLLRRIDSLDFLLSHEPAIAAYEREHG